MTAGDGKTAAAQAGPDGDEYWHWFTALQRDEVTISEQAVVGAIITTGALAAQAAAVLRPHRGTGGAIPQYFGLNSHQLVYETVMAMLDAGTVIEPTTVCAELARAGMLHRIGDNTATGGNYLHTLMTRSGTVGYHAGKVLAAWQQRNVSIELRSCSQIAAGPDFDPDVTLDTIRARVEAATSYAGPSALRPPWLAVNEMMGAQEAGTGDPGLSTGYPDLDGALGGLRNGEVTVIGATPGTGKTTLGLNIADYIAGTLGLPVLFASLEMREEQLTCKRVAAAASVPLSRLVRHHLEPGDWDRIARIHPDLTASALYVDDTPGQSLAQIRGRLAEMTRLGHPARLAVIDHLGLVAEPKAENRQQAVALLARQVKTLARTFGIPVILICPVNRGPASRPDRRPRMADLRDSGEVEGNADNVLLLWRDDTDPARAGEVEVIIAKNRMGPVATILLGFQGGYSRIVSLADEWHPSAAAAPDPAPDPVIEHERAAQEHRDEVGERRAAAAVHTTGQ